MQQLSVLFAQFGISFALHYLLARTYVLMIVHLEPILIVKFFHGVSLVQKFQKIEVTFPRLVVSLLANLFKQIIQVTVRVVLQSVTPYGCVFF